ncbi:MAG TPA: hypothetical protein VFF21_08725 [Flavobacteriaceae bacterium]|nr:hypothetical protein [Flavobacteriaceae bacterium]
MPTSTFPVLLGLVFVLIGKHCFSQTEDSIRYFDENYHPITKETFDQKRYFGGTFIGIRGDSIHHTILAYRKIRGTIANKSSLDSLLADATNTRIDPEKPIVVIYYPGKDNCNSTGTTNRKKFGKQYDRLEKRIDRIQKSHIFYIYKDKEGLYDRYDGFKTWIADPQGIFEKTFFSRHYPCSSEVVISPSGKFISSRGESDLMDIIQMIKDLKE